MKEERLLSLLRRKKGFFEAILDLTEEEGDLPVQSWLESLEQKKLLLSHIEEIDAEMDPFKQSLRHISQEISEELENIRYIIKRILHLDLLNHEKRKYELNPNNGFRH